MLDTNAQTNIMSDKLNRPSTIYYEDGTVTNYSWDATGNPTSISIVLPTALPIELLEFIAWPETKNNKNTSKLRWIPGVTY